MVAAAVVELGAPEAKPASPVLPGPQAARSPQLFPALAMPGRSGRQPAEREEAEEKSQQAPPSREEREEREVRAQVRVRVQRSLTLEQAQVQVPGPLPVPVPVRALELVLVVVQDEPTQGAQAAPPRAQERPRAPQRAEEQAQRGPAEVRRPRVATVALPRKQARAALEIRAARELALGWVAAAALIADVPALAGPRDTPQ